MVKIGLERLLLMELLIRVVVEAVVAVQVQVRLAVPEL
jgi:hypothetical protein